MSELDRLRRELRAADAALEAVRKKTHAKARRAGRKWPETTAEFVVEVVAARHDVTVAEQAVLACVRGEK